LISIGLSGALTFTHPAVQAIAEIVIQRIIVNLERFIA
jgi:hypothetical protein